MDDFYTYNTNSGYFPEDVVKIEPWKQGFSFGDAGRGENRLTNSNRQQPSQSRPSTGNFQISTGAGNRQPQVTVNGQQVPNRNTGRFSFGDIGRGESRPSTGNVHLSFGTGMGQPSVSINGKPVSSSNLGSSPVRFEWSTTGENGQSGSSSRIGVRLYRKVELFHLKST